MAYARGAVVDDKRPLSLAERQPPLSNKSAPHAIDPLLHPSPRDHPGNDRGADACTKSPASASSAITVGATTNQVGLSVELCVQCSYTWLCSVNTHTHTQPNPTT